MPRRARPRHARGIAECARFVRGARRAAGTSLRHALQDAVGEGVPRVLVAGGDGTIAAAATRSCRRMSSWRSSRRDAESFCARPRHQHRRRRTRSQRRRGEQARGVDIGMVNGHVFLNTSSVGAYVRFVRMREYLERRFGYRIASAIAAFRLLFGMQQIAWRSRSTARAGSIARRWCSSASASARCSFPRSASASQDGRRGLHVIVVRSRSRARLLAIALNAVARGVQTAAQEPGTGQLPRGPLHHHAARRRRSSRSTEKSMLARVHARRIELEARRDLRVVCP